MRKISNYMLSCALFLTTMVSAQSYKPTDVCGIWLNEDKDAHIEISQDGEKFFGKIVWLKNPNDEETGLPKRDKENPDEVLRQRYIMGIQLLSGFVYDGDGEWDDGDIYDPKSGKTYSCYMELQEMDKLKIRGYVGISLLGRTTYWTRVKEQQ